MRRVISLFLLVLPGAACRGNVWLVDHDGPADFRTVGAAVAEAGAGDSVVVRPGLYIEDINFPGRDIVLTSVAPDDSRVVSETIIRGLVQFQGTEGPACLLAGFKIDGSVLGYDGRLDPNGVPHTQATIHHCILESILTGCGGVLRGCDGTIRHCVVAHIGYLCRRAWPVPAIVNCSGRFENCTFVDAADGMEVQAGETLTLTNCIVYHGTPVIVDEGGTLRLAYCDIEGGLLGIFGEGTINWGPGNIDVDPGLARLGDAGSAGDYHLRSQVGRWDADGRRWVVDDVSSPCLDAGDPGSDWRAELWPHGRRINLGAYGGTAEASLSLSSLGCAANLDYDDTVQMADFALLAGAWLAEGALLQADFDRDGRIDFNDFARWADVWRIASACGQAPFELVLGRNATWAAGQVGYDWRLPGFHVVGDIASVILRGRTRRMGDTLVLAIRTSPGLPPMLENFTLAGPDVKLDGAPLNPEIGLTYFRKAAGSETWEAMPGVGTDAYLTFAVVGDEVRVTFAAPALDLLQTECMISWIDWYR
jgi:hypothetical protein